MDENKQNEAGVGPYLKKNVTNFIEVIIFSLFLKSSLILAIGR